MLKTHTMMLLFVALVLGFSGLASAKTVTVQKGDSMWIIAKRYNVSFAEVLHLNSHYQDVHLIHPGDKIELPTGSTGTNTEVHSDNDSIGHGNLTAVETDIPSHSEEILLLVNAERKKQGLKELSLSSQLTNIATMKAKDMANKNYFSHTSPTYGSPFQMLQSFGVSYKSAGENIAAGQRSAQEVMQSWMNSSGHRANILNPSYTELGVGYATGGTYRTEWVQLFIGK